MSVTEKAGNKKQSILPFMLHWNVSHGSSRKPSSIEKRFIWTLPEDGIPELRSLNALLYDFWGFV
jgi:hypothetical protein